MKSLVLLPSFLGVALLAACGGSVAGPGDNNQTVKPSHQAYRYLDSCTPSACGDAIPKIGCASGETTPICSGAACTWSVECSGGADDGTTSWSTCSDSQCGAAPTAPPDACPDGYKWSEPSCGSLNDGACSWAQSCYPKPSTEACAESECPEMRDTMARLCNDGSTGQVVCRRLPNRCDWQHECPEDFATPGNPGLDESKLSKECHPEMSSKPNGGCVDNEQCVTFDGKEGAFCVTDPCAALTCETGKECLLRESYPAQVSCGTTSR